MELSPPKNFGYAMRGALKNKGRIHSDERAFRGGVDQAIVAKNKNNSCSVKSTMLCSRRIKDSIFTFERAIYISTFSKITKRNVNRQ